MVQTFRLTLQKKEEMNTFLELGVDSNLVKGLKELNIINPTPIQEEAIPLLLNSETDFMQVSGVGEAKKDKYATRFLKVINAWAASKKSTQELSFSLFEKGMTVDNIATQRELKEDTVYGHFQKVHEEGKPIDLYQFISEEEVRKIQVAKTELGDQVEGVKSYFMYFEEQIPYWKIRMALYLLENKS